MLDSLHQQKDQEKDLARMDSTSESPQHIDAGQDRAIPTSASDAQVSVAPASPLPGVFKIGARTKGMPATDSGVWHVDIDTTACGVCARSDGEYLAALVYESAVGKREAKRMARYIVQACNLYPELLAALKAICDDAGGGELEGDYAGCVAVNDRLITIALEAIAKAEA